MVKISNYEFHENTTVIEPLLTNSRFARQIMVKNYNSEFYENTTVIEPLFTKSRLPRQINGKELQLGIS